VKRWAALGALSLATGLLSACDPAEHPAACGEDRGFVTWAWGSVPANTTNTSQMSHRNVRAWTMVVGKDSFPADPDQFGHAAQQAALRWTLKTNGCGISDTANLAITTVVAGAGYQGAAPRADNVNVFDAAPIADPAVGGFTQIYGYTTAPHNGASPHYVISEADVRIDCCDGVNWGPRGSNQLLKNLEDISLHELGHTMGLGHVGLPGGNLAMGYNYVQDMIGWGDIAGMNCLYPVTVGTPGNRCG
jgi:hypothetical protein